MLGCYICMATVHRRIIGAIEAIEWEGEDGQGRDRGGGGHGPTPNCEL